MKCPYKSTEDKLRWHELMSITKSELVSMVMEMEGIERQAQEDKGYILMEENK